MVSLQKHVYYNRPKGEQEFWEKRSEDGKSLDFDCFSEVLYFQTLCCHRIEGNIWKLVKHCLRVKSTKGVIHFVI